MILNYNFFSLLHKINSFLKVYQKLLSLNASGIIIIIMIPAIWFYQPNFFDLLLYIMHEWFFFHYPKYLFLHYVKSVVFSQRSLKRCTSLGILLVVIQCTSYYFSLSLDHGPHALDSCGLSSNVVTRNNANFNRITRVYTYVTI